ncbi:MAG TPA: hypothetical protein VM118_13610, partial [Acidobacteriota bacterium]|nr:hypothetical protein [Acidobacteriota bacterium]
DPSQHFGKTDGLYFPRGTNRTVIFAAGLWVGALVNGNPRVTVAEHTSEWGPGPMEDGTYSADVGRFHVYKVDRSDDANTNPDYANWPWEDSAPNLLAADGSDSLDADGNLIPLVLGDQALWAVYNDADAKRHISDLGSTEPLGLEVKQYIFAFARSGALGNSIYLRYEIVNHGSNLLEDTYVSIWCDADVGDAFDDLVGCDTVRGIGYAYNQGPDDIYGQEAPAVGFDFLQGPMVPSPGDEARLRGRTIADYRNLPMTTFSNYDNGVDPRNAIESYNLMRGLGLDGEPVIDPDGNPTTFQFAGDPVTGEGWNDAYGDDRRFMMSSGPFTMAPGDTQEVVIAVLVGQGADHIGSITALKSTDEQVQAVFDLDFIIPFPPPQPTVWSQPLSGQIELVWSRDAEGDVQESEILGQRFVMEGYNVYQGETKTGPWRRIGTFDLDNDITKIYRDRFDSDIGAVQRVVAQSGSNSGLTNHLTIDVDRFTGRGLVAYNPYYFAITAYSYDELNVEEFQVGANVIGHLTEDLESRIEGIEIVPRSLAVELLDTAVHIAGQSEGTVVIRTLEPDSVVTSDYLVTFNDDLSWNLDNLTTDTRVLADQTNSTGDYYYELLEGIMVQVIGPEPDIKDVTWSGSAEPWATSIAWGGRFYGEGVDMGAWFFGSSIEDARELVPVEIRFSPTNTQQAYRYVRG